MQLIVLGMHRSGTSVLARLLNLMGAYFGPEGISTGGNQENPKGFWERRDVRLLNDTVLHAVGCDWNRISALDVGALPEIVTAEFRERASKLILEMDAHRPWFMKEPRLCLLLPLWRQVLEAPVCIHIYRNPVEVASSLLTRNQMPMLAGLALWEKYVSSARMASAGLPSLSVSHHRLMTDPMPEVERIFSKLAEHGVSGLRMPSAREVAAFIDPKLYRERSSRKDLSEFAQAPQVHAFKALEDDLSQAEGMMARLSPDNGEHLAAYESSLPPLQPKAEPKKVIDAAQVALREQLAARDQENKMLREASAKRDEALRDLDQRRSRELVTLGELQAKVVRCEQDLERRRLEGAAELKQRDDMLQALQDKLEGLQDRLEGLQDKIAQLNAESAVACDRIERLTADLESATGRTVELQQSLDLAREEQAAREAELSRQATLARDLEATLRKAEQSLADRFREIATLSRRVLDQEAGLAAAKASLASHEAELEATRDALANMRASRAWKLTKPLRAAGRLLKGRRQAAADPVNEAAMIESTGLFDRSWYLRTYEDVARNGADPIEHYLLFGATEGRDPGPDFDTAGYLKRNPDVQEAGINPLVHYAMHGKIEGRLPK